MLMARCRRFLVWGTTLALAACGVRQEAERVELPSPAREGARHGGRASQLNAECEGCHEEIASEWRDSLHHESFTNHSFQAAFEREPMAFCQSCHAPEADPLAPAPAALGALGVGCTSCHLTGAGVLAAPGPGAPETAPHPLVRLASFGSNAACANCHEFAFPAAAARGRPELMQSTHSEQRSSASPFETCADCHMPRSGQDGHRAHGFHASRDNAFLRRAVSVTAQRVAPERVRVDLRPSWLGHAFPTGDLFRRLRVSAEAVGPDYQLWGSDERFLTRHFSRKRVGPGLDRMELRHDDRVGLSGSAPSQVLLELGPNSATAPIAWRVSYQRVAHPRSVDERDAVVEADEEIAVGLLPPPTSAPESRLPR